ncbi:MAG: hypothetical protein HN509_07490 [Halobacteriovoraceae bacterium]|jgi:hypothetical protein|nr:hypothetical protein [Halobacteriovoraceae bacterium]MBT5092635.1 hypothetical protein [Halobacteriovoraceae bacterium]
MKFILIVLLLSGPLLASESKIEFKSLSTKKDKLLIFYPPYANKDFFELEVGFKGDKKAWNYPYHSFVSAFLFEKSIKFSDTNVSTNHPEFSVNGAKKIKAAALGVKAGLILPTNPWFPLFAVSSLGLGKTVLHQDPWAGRNDGLVSEERLYQLELGLMYQFGDFLLRGNAYFSSTKYLSGQYHIGAGLVF